MARIMIVDDEPDVREALAAMIGAAGHEARVAAEGNAALMLLPQFQPDLVITDILMPGMEGIQTIYELRKRQPDLPIIAMSGGERFDGMSYLGAAERLGANHSIAKPISPHGLLAAITALLAAGRTDTGHRADGC